MEKGRVFETVVGIFVLVVTASFFSMVYNKSSWKRIDGYVLTASFDRADGLADGSDVKISGITVGKIVDLRVDPKTFVAVVKFRIPNEIQLPVDSAAKVDSDGLFGGKYLSIIPGGEDEVLKPNDEIERTIGPVNLESLVGKFLSPSNSDSKPTVSEYQTVSE